MQTRYERWLNRMGKIILYDPERRLAGLGDSFPAGETAEHRTLHTFTAEDQLLFYLEEVDEDVDIFDTDDVLWALNTRYQGDVDTIFIPGVRCHPLDPSQRPDYSPSIPDVGISCKTIFDCTVPFRMKERFRRAEFMEVDPEKWIKKG